MSRKVFEYYFDREDLEPFFSELPKSLVEPSPSPVANGRAPEQPVVNSERAEVADDNGGPSEVSDNVRPATKSVEEAATAHQQSTRATKSAETNSPRMTDDDLRKTAEPVTESVDGSRTRVRRLFSVHALGQYVFCPRSGILAAEKGDQRDVDDELPRFTYLPNFDRERIEEALSGKLTQFCFFLLYGVCLVVLMKMGLADQNRWVFYPSALALFVLGFWSLGTLVAIAELTLRRHAAIRAEAHEPEPDIRDIERVNWWSLLKAGLEPIQYQQPFQHPELPLEGCPWRVLQRGSRRIPVIRSGTHKLGDRKGELYVKHQVRLVAYALLLESTGHIEVPYGVVFPVDSPLGLAFPITDELRQRTVSLLHDFQQQIVASQQQQSQPETPPNRNRCTNCDYGKPVPTTTEEVQHALRAAQQLVVLQNRDGDLYRCECGDRFGSAPPHGVSVKKGLKVVVY